MEDCKSPLGLGCNEGLGPLPLWRDDGGRSWWGSDELTGEHILIRIAHEVAVERARLRMLVEAMRDANYDAEDGDTFRLLKPGQERFWNALLAGLKGPNVRAKAANTAR